MPKKLIVLSFFLIICSSCVVSQDEFKKTQNDIYYLQMSNNRINQRISNLEKEVATIKTKLDKMDKSNTSLKATQALNYNELSSELKSLRNEIQDFKNFSNKRAATSGGETSEVTKEAIKDIYSRLNDIEKEVSLLKTNASSSSISGKSNFTVKDDKYYYKEAYGMFTAGKYSEAAKKFKAFLNNFKDSKLRPNAYYWLGECYFKMRMYDKAIINYDEVIVKYKKNSKVPAALLKEGISFLKIGEKDGAKLIFRKIIHDYPKTRQARYARDYLKRLK